MTALALPRDVKELSRLSKEEWREFTRSVWSIPNTSDAKHPAVFPVAIPERLIRLFSFHGELVLDPFCGVGTTGLAAVRVGRQFFGQDLNGGYAREARRRLASETAGPGLWTVQTGDSRHLPLADRAAQLVVTSPPYWNKADYGRSRANVGRIGEYDAFIDEMRPFFREVFRVLQPGRRFCVVTANVNQHTTEGLLTYPLATDLINLARKVGFLLVNQIVWSKEGTGGRWGSANGQRPIFGSYPYPPNFMFKNLHEFILIFKRPASAKGQAELRLIKSATRPSPTRRRRSTVGGRQA